MLNGACVFSISAVHLRIRIGAGRTFFSAHAPQTDLLLLLQTYRNIALTHITFAGPDEVLTMTSATNEKLAPRGWHCVTPRIVVDDSRGLIDFLKVVFQVSKSVIEDSSPSIVEIGQSKIMISEPGPREPRTAFLYVYVSDVDAAYRRALEQGAFSLEEPIDAPYGDRRCMVSDKWGNWWQIATRDESGGE